jgi:hypothetical protein
MVIVDNKAGSGIRARASEWAEDRFSHRKINGRWNKQTTVKIKALDQLTLYNQEHKLFNYVQILSHKSTEITKYKYLVSADMTIYITLKCR